MSAKTPILMVLCASSAAAAARHEQRPLSGQAYVGLFCRDHPESGGMLVGWVMPGPLKGKTFTSPSINRGDIILAVNGKPMGKKAFEELLARSKPGDAIELRVRLSKGKEDTAVPEPGKGGEEKTLKVVLASKADWSGPVSFRRAFVVPPLGGLVEGKDPTPLEKLLDPLIAQHKLREPLDKLKKYLADTQTEDFGANSLSRVAAGFYRPTRLPELQKLITDPLAKLPADPREVFLRAADNLDLAPPPLGPDADFSDPAKAIAWMKARLAEAARLREQAFAKIPAKRQKALAKDLHETVDYAAAEHYLMSHPEPARILAALRASMEVDHQALLSAAAILGEVLRPGKPPVGRIVVGGTSVSREGQERGAETPRPQVARLPRKLRGAVEGDILAAEQADGRWIVVGGFGPNRYDLSKIDVVIDPGGDDAYHYSSEDRPPIQVVVDFAGNDKYEGGPASATLGISILVDAAGNDRYEGNARSCGVGVMGVGILADLAGNDTYAGTSWSLGAGVYGVGAILDLGGSDTYTAEYLSEGVGGPRGFGLILDAGGNDLYRANGPKGSVYETPAVYASFSQGMGFGFRMYESGGIGVLADLGGDDRYEAGEFAQGGAYYWALGILYDRSGNDLYYGNRYGQGFGCHQAIGILADDAGDDTYWAMCAACQGAAWDIAAGLLIDRGGNDSYQAEGLAQGSAAMQAIGWLIDLGGTDRYVARGGAVHGCSSGNSYHHAETGCFSWSLLLDAGGGPDFYSSGRPNNQVLAPGERNDKKPEDSPLHGLFIDSAERARF
ncbi:MAG: hypothetical protein FJ291_27120 [Planctomycetes bacterium]|nr:hypothetical protein [Planctomycetota bacterium]